MASSLLYISEDEVQSLLNKDDLFSVIEQAFADVSSKTEGLIIQPPRGFMHMPSKNAVLLTMPGLSERRKALACKIVTSFVNNPKNYNLPSILANIMLFDPETGRMRAVVAGTAITEWRTACASAVATKHLSTKRKVLAVLGAGKQGRIHIIAFQHFFQFEKVRLWNRTHANAVKLATELKQKFGIEVEVFQTVKDCTRDADVIVTATYSSQPIVKYEDIKPDAFINAVGAGINHHSELHTDIYEKSTIYTDSLTNAKVELKGLEDQGFRICGEVGEVINGTKSKESGLVIFHSLGMAVEDAVAAELIYNAFQRKQGSAV
ncbi:UNVERIFIED_CONTAM: hypothetical protein PYX00_005655 [Menopon gallinae]|uniref:Ketimine reductase mu-crystallin n=1 Tax=Menopon gallinae TaxID=328185 RepID=A0AAW2HSZ3_9NEOP